MEENINIFYIVGFEDYKNKKDLYKEMLEECVELNIKEENQDDMNKLWLSIKEFEIEKGLIKL